MYREIDLKKYHCKGNNKYSLHVLVASCVLFANFPALCFVECHSKSMQPAKEGILVYNDLAAQNCSSQ